MTGKALNLLGSAVLVIDWSLTVACVKNKGASAVQVKSLKHIFWSGSSPAEAPEPRRSLLGCGAPRSLARSSRG